MPALVFNQRNREAHFVIDFFANADEGAGKVAWRQGMGRGAAVAAGDEIATLTWNDGSQEPTKAPGGCNGVIARLNRAIPLDDLERHPAVWALWLE